MPRSKHFKFVKSSRVHLKARVRKFARGTKPGMVVLDAGAGHSPFKSMFGHAQYEAADFAQLQKRYAPLDYVCDLTDIPVEDNRFDRIVMTQVLEHVAYPPQVLAELHRVMKPGGRILCSVPFFYEEHETPYDFFRYTQFALHQLFEDAGFENARVEWLEGYFGTVSYQFDQMARHLPRDTSRLNLGRRRVYVVPLLWATRKYAKFGRVAFSRADLRWKHTASGHPKNYVVIARKPASDEQP